jgi:MFS family permease
MPALNAFYLDITAKQHKSRVMGVKESAAALGGVLGPLAVVAISGLMTPQGTFFVAGVLMISVAGLALVTLRAPRQTNVEIKDISWECSQRRALAAEAALQGIVLSAGKTRQRRSVI